MTHPSFRRQDLPRSGPIGYDADLNQDIQVDKNIKIYFDWIAKHDDVYHLGTDGAAIEDLYYSIQQQLRRNPFGTLGPDEWNDIFVGAAYYVRPAPADQAGIDSPLSC